MDNKSYLQKKMTKYEQVHKAQSVPEPKKSTGLAAMSKRFDELSKDNLTTKPIPQERRDEQEKQAREDYEKHILHEGHAHPNFSDRSMGVWNGLHMYKPSQHTPSSTITSKYGEGMMFAGKNDDKTHAVTKGPIMVSQWKNAAQAKQSSHFGHPGFGTPEREATFDKLSQEFGLGHYVPQTGVFIHPRTGSSWSAMKYRPDLSNVKDYSKLRNKNDLYKMAIMDTILGNTDRHGGNIQQDPKGNVSLIDHGLAFNYASDSGFRKTTPHYAKHIQHAQIPPSIHNWLQNDVDHDAIVHKLATSGAPTDVVNTARDRLNQARNWSQGVARKNHPLNTLDALFGVQESRLMDLSKPQQAHVENAVVNEKMKDPKANSYETATKAIKSLSTQPKEKGTKMPDPTNDSGPGLRLVKSQSDMPVQDGDYRLYKTGTESLIGLIRVRNGMVVYVSDSLNVSEGPADERVDFELFKLNNGWNTLKFSPVQ